MEKASGGYQDNSGHFQPVDVAKVMEENKELKKRLACLEQEKSILKRHTLSKKQSSDKTCRKYFKIR